MKKQKNKNLILSLLPTGEGAVVGEFMSRTNADEGSSRKGKMSYHPLTQKSNIRIKLLFAHIDFLPSPDGRGKLESGVQFFAPNTTESRLGPDPTELNSVILTQSDSEAEGSHNSIDNAMLRTSLSMTNKANEGNTLLPTGEGRKSMRRMSIRFSDEGSSRRGTKCHVIPSPDFVCFAYSTTKSPSPVGRGKERKVA